MSKQVKIIIGVVAVVVILGCFLVGLAGFVVSRSRDFRALARPPQGAIQLDVRLLDDDKDGIPDRAVATLPGPAVSGRNPDRPERFDQGFSGQGNQLDVRLIDDNGDGVPDRGVVDIPAGSGFEPRFNSPQTFGRGSGRDWDQGRFTSGWVTPFAILGGLFRLAILAVVGAGLVGLGVVLYQQWRRPAPSPSVIPSQPEPEVEAAPADQETAALSTDEIEPELGPNGSEVAEPEEGEPNE